MNMEWNEHVEPGKADVGKEQNAATPVSLIGGAWDFMNMGIEVRSNLEVEIPKPPDWATCEEHGSEDEVTVTEMDAFGEGERPEASPLEVLRTRL